MEHPFISDLSDKSLEDLQEALSGLTTKIMFAYQTGNQPLIHQLTMVINSYKSEHQKKLDVVFSKQNIGDNINIDGRKK
tara:strand:- start:1977 stop:2213 length:237 start_codon:yes stop_codon:yes gene_type:complete